MVKIEELKDFILCFPSERIDIGSIVDTFWHDTTELKELAKTLKDWKERKLIRANLRRRVERVRLAFNQLFLEERVKNHQGVTFSEMKEGAITNCERHIETTRQMVQKGEGGIMTQCWLGNLIDYLESYKHTEILNKGDMSSFLKHIYKPKGRLIAVGSELVMQVYPSRIKVVQHN